MARNDGFPPDDEMTSPPRSRGTNAPARTVSRPTAEEADLDPRLLDLDDAEETPFLRAPKRVPVRRGAPQNRRPPEDRPPRPVVPGRRDRGRLPGLPVWRDLVALPHRFVGRHPD